MRERRIDIPLFKTCIIALKGDMKELSEYVALSYGMTVKSDCRAAYVLKEGIGYILYNPENITLPELVHETCHAACGIMKTAGINDEETQCYLIQYIIGQLWES